ncbi:MAG: hypothetical protein HY902_18820, partial [Deltaproteobacteria bacterium]|nr:hypothetical protein [Deltaproteobacteria bacterium]
DGCDPKTGCTGAANTAPCDDGNTCTTKDICSAGICKGNLGACNDNNPCTDESCPSGTCVHTANTAQCSDGNACTSGDVCKAGACSGPGKLDCDDKNVCTDDSCDAGSGCAHVANAAQCDDGNACTAGDACLSGSCAGNKIDCGDTNLCTDDSCDPKKGCVNAANVAACNDGNPCTSGDACLAGKCAPGKAKSCDDNNVCTQDSCLTSTGQCQNLDTSGQDCDDKSACTDDVCHPVLGCGHTNNTAKCSDGNPCTTGDGCLGGKCTTTGTLACNDSNPCTDDSCDGSQGGCLYTANTATCDDGVGCTKSDTCSQGKCAGTLNCSDGNPCTDDACDFGTGKCAATFNTASCDDKDACTTSDLCSNGKCAGTKLVVCTDDDPCTDNQCDSVLGCKVVANTAHCTLAGQCTAYDVCQNMKCTPGPVPRFFTRTYGQSTVNERALALVLLPDGGAMLAGWTDTSGTDPALWRVDAGGQYGPSYPGTFEKIFSNAAEDRMQSAALAPDGKVLVAGYGLNNYGMFLSKYDLTGKVVWTGKTTDGGYPNANAITTRTVSGSLQYVVCGGYDAGGGPSARLAYFSEAGTLLVATKWAGPNGAGHFMECRDVVANSDGTMLWAGWTTDTNDPNQFLVGKRAAILQTVDTGWGAYDRMTVKRYGGSEDDAFLTLAAAKGPIPGWFAGGYTHSKVAGKRHAWLVRLNAKLDVVWEVTLGGANNAGDQVNSVLAMPDGGVAVAGAQMVSGQTKTYSFVARYDANGVAMAWPAIGGSGGTYHEYFDLAQAANGDVWFAGAFADVGAKDQWVVRRLSPFGSSSCSLCPDKLYTDCDDGNFCTVDTCDTSSNCQHGALAGMKCTDGNACTDPDTCSGSSCVVGPAVNCDDGNPCTTETCDQGKGCVYNVVADGVACATGKTCQSSTDPVTKVVSSTCK